MGEVSSNKKLYGTATIGSKGQVVIPAEAREDLGLKPGDRLYVINAMHGSGGLVFLKEEMRVDELLRFSANIRNEAASLTHFWDKYSQPEDDFTNRFAALARIAPALPLIGGGLTRMQPVYVGDVATAVADAVDGKTRPGATYELGGPEVLTMREIMEIILRVIERRRMLLSLPFGLAKFQAHFLRFAPGPLKLTPDQVRLLRSDNVVSPHAKAAGLTLEGLGITPDSLEAIAPQYLWRFRKTGQFAHKGA